LVEIGAGDIPILTAFNKIDMLNDPESAILKLEEFTDTYPISAKLGLGIQVLLKAIEDELFETFIEIEVDVPYQEGQMLSLIHEHGQVQELRNEATGTHVRGLVPRRLLFRFEPYLAVDSEGEEHFPSENED
jgi:GTP-binding protein HflX